MEEEPTPEPEDQTSPPEEDHEDGNPDKNSVMNFFKTLVSGSGDLRCPLTLLQDDFTPGFFLHSKRGFAPNVLESGPM